MLARRLAEYMKEVALEELADDPLLKAQLQRVVRQLTVIHGAATRRAALLGPEPVNVAAAPGIRAG